MGKNLAMYRKSRNFAPEVAAVGSTAILLTISEPPHCRHKARRNDKLKQTQFTNIHLITNKKTTSV